MGWTNNEAMETLGEMYELARVHAADGLVPVALFLLDDGNVEMVQIDLSERGPARLRREVRSRRPQWVITMFDAWGYSSPDAAQMATALALIECGLSIGEIPGAYECVYLVLHGADGSLAAMHGRLEVGACGRRVLSDPSVLPLAQHDPKQISIAGRFGGLYGKEATDGN